MKYIFAFVLLSHQAFVFATESDDRFSKCIVQTGTKPGGAYTSGDRGRSAALLLHECREQLQPWLKECIASVSGDRAERECTLRAGVAAQAVLLLNECKMRGKSDAGIPC